MARHPLTPMTDSDLVRVLGRQTRSPRRPRPPRRRPHSAGGAPRRSSVATASPTRSRMQSRTTTYAARSGDGRPAAARRAAQASHSGCRGAFGIDAAQPYERRPRRRPCDRRRRQLLRRDARTDRDDGGALSRRSGRRHECGRRRRRHVEAAARTSPAERCSSTRARRPDEVARAQERARRRAGRRGRRESLLAEVARRAVDAGARRVVVAGGETSGAVIQALGDPCTRGRRRDRARRALDALARRAAARARAQVRATSAAPTSSSRRSRREREPPAEIVEVGRSLFDRGLSPGTSGQPQRRASTTAF